MDYNSKIALYQDELRKYAAEGDSLGVFLAGCAATDLIEAQEENRELVSKLTVLLIAYNVALGRMDKSPDDSTLVKEVRALLDKHTL